MQSARGHREVNLRNPGTGAGRHRSRTSQALIGLESVANISAVGAPCQCTLTVLKIDFETVKYATVNKALS